LGLSSTLKFVASHPLGRRHRLRSFWRVARWQLVSRLLPHPMLFPFVNGTRIAVERGLSGATGNIYVGLHEFEDMAFVLHVLRPTDLFCDIGANVGVYTVLASGVVGTRTISFEPVPGTNTWLKLNAAINQIADRVELHEVALGAEVGSTQFTLDLGPANRVAVRGGESVTTMSVPISTLDRELAGRVPAVIKIDVEGFETAVMDGARETLASNDLKCIIMELNGSGRAFGYDEAALKAKLMGLGFAEYSYRPFERRLVAKEMSTAENVLLIRDTAWAAKRVAEAPAFSVLGEQI
jgi:FkbM family methyltransferase